MSALQNRGCFQAFGVIRQTFSFPAWLVAFFVLTGSPMIVSADMPEVPRGKGDMCVEPTEIMRKQHMDFLLHDRDLTMRQGNRDIKHSLNQCVECHAQTDAQGEFISINDSGQFCAVCHEFTSVKIDCFECHATKPDTPMSANRSEPETLADRIAEVLAQPVAGENL